MATLTEHLVKNDILAAFLALGFVMLSYIGFPGEIFAAILVAFITLRKSWKSGFLVLSFVAVPAVALVALRRIGPLDIVFAQCLLVYVFACILGRSSSWRLVMQVIMLLSLLIVAVLHVYLGDVASFWVKHIGEVINKLQSNGAMSTDNIKQILGRIVEFKQYLTGVFIFGIFSALLCQLLVARFWQSRSLNKRSFFKREFIQIRLGYVEAVLFTAVAIGVFAHQYLAQDLLFAFMLPFLLSGFSYLHYMQQRYNKLIYVLVLCYLCLLITPVSSFIAFILAAVGYVDSILNLRKRITL